MLHDIDTYLAGINLWYSRNQPSRGPSTAPTSTRSTRSRPSTSARAAATRSPTRCCSTPRATSSARGAATGSTRTCAAATTRRRRRPARCPPRGRRGSRSAARAASSGSTGDVPEQRAEAARPGRGAPTALPRPEASNVLLVDGDRSATGAPLFAGGPQISYNYPGLTLEMGLYGPNIRVRGATSAPFPGYMLIGRGKNFAWTLTSPEVDIVDTYAERLCGGSRTRYVYKGKCRRMRHDPRRDDREGRRERQRHVQAHGPRAGRRLRARRGLRADGRAVAQAVDVRARDGRPDLLPAADVRASEERRRLHRGGQDGRRRRSTRSMPPTARSPSTRPAACRGTAGASTTTCRSTAAAGTSGAASSPARAIRSRSTRRAGCS